MNKYGEGAILLFEEMTGESWEKLREIMKDADESTQIELFRIARELQIEDQKGNIIAFPKKK